MTSNGLLRVNVVGSGIAGLSAAHALSCLEGVEVTVFEQDEVVGGRANTIDGGEHCARLFLDDYEVLLRLFREIPFKGGTVFDALEPLRRYCYTSRQGWVENTGIYPLLSRNLSLAERFELAGTKRLSPLIAEQRFASSSNRYGNRKNFTLATKARVFRSALSPRVALALSGPTETHLLDPWVAHLEGRGVRFRTSSRVTLLERTSTGVAVEVGGTRQPGHVTVLTAFVSDALPLLELSGVSHTVIEHQHSYCKCFTIQLDPREAILRDPTVRLYAHDGLSVTVQPEAARCTALCTFSVGTSEDWVLPRVRAFLGLQHRLGEVRSRANTVPREGLFHATLVDPASQVQAVPGLHLAGSWIHNSYLLDAGEGAARTAIDVVARLQAQHQLANREELHA